MFTREEYERQRRDFRWDIPEDFSIVRLVDRYAAADPGRPCVLWAGEDGARRKLQWGELADQSSRFAAVLAELGVRKGDPVLHILPRIREAFIVQLGTFKAGGVAVPCTELLRAKEVAYRAEVAGARVVVAHASAAPEVDAARGKCPLEQFVVVGGDRSGWRSFDRAVGRAAPAESVPLAADDPMTINFTSGTTGNPKPVMHRHRWIYGHLRVTARYWWAAGRDDLIWATTAPGWAKWYWSPVGVGLASGAAQLIYWGRFDPQRYLDLLSEYPVTKLCATPTEYRMIVAHVPDLGARRGKLHLRDALSAGEPLNAEVIDTFKRALGITIRDGYGQTESVCLVCNYPGLPVRAGSMGVPTPGPGATVVDEAGEPVGRGDLGEIAVPVGSPGIFDGYWNDPEYTAQVFSGRWYRTGDLARVDEDGYLFFEGRADDIILSAGYRIGPFEVEDALVAHPAVAEAAVVGSPHPERGEIVKAFVVLAPGYDPNPQLVEELQHHVKRTTAPYKYPREVAFVADLPKTASGKIRRAELRRGERERKGSDA
ncbi:MAG: acyl-CoA synthetase [Candidatus Bipolaricaulaceae bacterium]